MESVAFSHNIGKAQKNTYILNKKIDFMNKKERKFLDYVNVGSDSELPRLTQIFEDYK